MEAEEQVEIQKSNVAKLSTFHASGIVPLFSLRVQVLHLRSDSLTGLQRSSCRKPLAISKRSRRYALPTLLLTQGSVILTRVQRVAQLTQEKSALEEQCSEHRARIESVRVAWEMLLAIPDVAYSYLLNWSGSKRRTRPAWRS